MKLKNLPSSKVAGKKFIVRVDYNVPVKNGEIQDSKRVEISTEMIKFLLENGAKQVFLMSHRGRPHVEESWEKTITTNKDLSLKIIIPILEKKLGIGVGFCSDLKSGCEASEEKVVLLENLRFDKGEKKNSKEFAQKLAKLADIYVNDAFSTSHRAHASFAAISELLPSYAGTSLINEVKMLSKLTQDPKKPFVIIVGGAKISDKVSAIENLAKIADTVLVGGGVANNFLKADGFNVAKSYLQDVPADVKKQGVDFVKFADKLLDTNQQEHTLIDDFIPLPKIIYPIDVMVAKNPEAKKSKVVNLMDCEGENCHDKDDMFLDIGPKTIKLFSKVLSGAKTIFWNGPMGVFENEVFAGGTKKIAQAVAKSGAQSILGGGETISAVKKFGLRDEYTYVSTSGGASLEFLSGKELPGLKNILEK
jgi:3-phosphoglycerate kinase